MIILIIVILMMAPKILKPKKTKKKATVETDSETLPEVVVQNTDEPEPEPEEAATLTRSLPPTPQGKGKTPTPRKRAKQSPAVTSQAPITHEMEDELVDWFEAHPIFFDQSTSEFKNRAKRDNLLAQKAEELGVTRSTLWTWLTNMRTVFGRLKKKKSGQNDKPLTARQKFIRDRFQFLNAHLQVRSTTRVLGALEMSTLESEPDTSRSRSLSDPQPLPGT